MDPRDAGSEEVLGEMKDYTNPKYMEGIILTEADAVETKFCPDCGRNLPVTRFQVTPKGSRMKSCMDCVDSKRKATRSARERARARENGPVSDPRFDGKDPREVLDMMGAAKRWLESRGYEIQLSGYYMERREIKF